MRSKEAESMPRVAGDMLELSGRRQEWDKKVPFGHCPACTQTGIEEGRTVTEDRALFLCSDRYCQTFFAEKTTDEYGGPVEKMVGGRTRWSEEKPKDWRKREIFKDLSWNELNFSQKGIKIEALL